MTDINTSELKQKNKIISFGDFEKDRIKQMKDFILGAKNRVSKEVGPCALVYKTYKGMNKDCKNIYHKIIFVNILVAVISGTSPFINMFLYGSLSALTTGTKIAISTFIFFILLRFIQNNLITLLNRIEMLKSNKLMELLSTHPDSLKRVKRLSELEN